MWPWWPADGLHQAEKWLWIRAFRKSQFHLEFRYSHFILQQIQFELSTFSIYSISSSWSLQICSQYWTVNKANRVTLVQVNDRCLGFLFVHRKWYEWFFKMPNSIEFYSVFMIMWLLFLCQWTNLKDTH